MPWTTHHMQCTVTYSLWSRVLLHSQGHPFWALVILPQTIMVPQHVTMGSGTQITSAMGQGTTDTLAQKPPHLFVFTPHTNGIIKATPEPDCKLFALILTLQHRLLWYLICLSTASQATLHATNTWFSRHRHRSLTLPHLPEDARPFQPRQVNATHLQSLQKGSLAWGHLPAHGNFLQWPFLLIFFHEWCHGKSCPAAQII